MSEAYEEVFRLFREHANAQQAIKMSAYMCDVAPFLGLQAPLRRKLAQPFITAARKEVARKEAVVDWGFVNRCWTMEREFQYLALDYLQVAQSLLTPEDIPRLRDLAIDKSWWDTIDCLDSIVDSIGRRFSEVDAIMLAWSIDDNFWLRRIAIDHQLQRKELTNTALLEQIIVNNFGQKEFFINKAIGWSLREYSKINPQWVKDFIAQHQEQLAPLSVREASKYI